MIERRTLVRGALVAAAGQLVLGCSAKGAAPGADPVAPAAAGTTPPPPVYDVGPLIDPAGKYLGVALPGMPDETSAVGTFTSEVGKAPNLLVWYAQWGTPLQSVAVSVVHTMGALPMIAYEPSNISCASIAAGATDAATTRLATAIRALDLPVALSFGHEMNGNWYPWGYQATKPAEFVAAWRHIHDLFVQAQATNVIWTWNPNVVNPMPREPLEPLYPGDAYVDWIGVTGYYVRSGQTTFDDLFSPTFEQVRTFTGKPFIITETAVARETGRAAMVTDLFHGVATRADVRGLAWFDFDATRADWRIENDSEALAAFRTAAAGPAFGFDVAAVSTRGRIPAPEML